MPIFTLAARTATLAGLFAPLAALAQITLPAPAQPPDPPAARTFYFAGGSSVSRAYLGITPRNSAGPADTLGLLVDDVESDLPAAKAGITRGARLVRIDDIDLRVDPRDLGDYAGESLPESRLRRYLARKEPGDTAIIIVLTDGRKDTKRVVLAESPFAATMRSLSSGRRVLGVSFSQRGSMRDTAGLLVISVTSGGAADKAGISEGDRIVSVDGVDLRVPASDAGTSDGVSARVSRFRRALDASRDSQPVKLDVLTNGRHRTVSVVPTRERGFTFTTAGLGNLANLRASIDRNFDDDWSSDRADAAREHAEARLEAMRESARDRAEAQREMQREQRAMAREMRESMRDGYGGGSDDRYAPSGTIRGHTDGATITLSGLSLAVVDSDFAQQFGRGSERGALVVRIRGDWWEPLKAGDVLLTVDSRSVRDGNGIDVSFDRRKELRLEILRNGKRETVTLGAR